MKKYLLAALLAASLAAPAAAYTSYLKADAYWPDDSNVEIVGSYASQFFTPQIAVPVEMRGRAPDGTEVIFQRIAVEGPLTRSAVSLSRAGTYRISTGEQIGGVTQLVGVDGQWRPLAQNETPPEGAPVTTLQTVTVADTYVTRGRPSREVVDAPHGRLAIKPITHPNEVLAASGFDIEVLFDGAPLANTAVVLYSEGDLDSNLDRFVVTDANGRAHVTFDAPGHYVIAARHRADMPAGSPAEVGSYTTTITFEALTEVPAGYDVVREQDRPPERRRRVGTWRD